MNKSINQLIWFKKALEGKEENQSKFTLKRINFSIYFTVLRKMIFILQYTSYWVHRWSNRNKFAIELINDLIEIYLLLN